MIKFLSVLFQTNKSHGYEFAAVTLLKQKDKGLAKLESCIEASKAFDSYNNFDKGVEEAIKDYKDLKNDSK